jgi:L-amino acid N-acyltransferase YncA
MSATQDRNFSEKTCNTMAVAIRPASIKDLHEIAVIWREGQVAQGIKPPDLDLALQIFRARLETEAEVFGVWVAEIERVLVGWQSLLPCRTSPLYKWAESSTYISARSRGRGVGRKLLEFATEHAKTVNLTHVVAFIIKDNEASIKMVESLGWQKVGDIPRSNPRDMEWLYYVYAVPNAWPNVERIHRGYKHS